MQYFDEARFKQQVSAALTRIRTVLDVARSPQYPADVPHRYEDKYGLAEFLTKTGIAAQLNALEQFGVTDKHLQTLKSWAQSRSVQLRFKSEEKCTFVREATRKVESSTQHVTEYKSSSGSSSSKTHKVVTTITEYFWKFEVEYEILAYKGNDPDEKLSFKTRKGECEIITTTKTPPPKPPVNVVPSIEVPITYLLQHLNDNLQPIFSIDRTDKKCHTPRRNQDITTAMEHFRRFYAFGQQVNDYFMNQLFPVQANHGLNLSAITAGSIFVPIVPLFEERKKFLAIEAPKSEGKEAEEDTPVLPVGDVNKFLAEQKRSIQEKHGEISKTFPDNGKLITLHEAQLLVTALHLKSLSSHYYDAIEYIELMLRRQVVAAIGKEVNATDFNNYMKFHYRKLYKSDFQPVPFSHAVRRPDHYPEGVLSIESSPNSGDISEPIFTNLRKITPETPMCFSIDAATKVVFHGDRYVHAYVLNSFEGNTGAKLSLVARARQFSCYMLLVGNILSPTEFDAKHAIILQNKDELIIPLLLEQIPSAKEFRDAIESLSPEQQRFCKAFRQMQLESSLFGVCIIQIKPQMEKLLKLPYDSLTKEIKLTQELLELFIKYQIPSDQLSYDGDEDCSAHVKVEKVKGYVKAMYDMINESKEKELKEKKQEAVFTGFDYGGLPTNQLVLESSNMDFLLSSISDSALPTSSSSSTAYFSAAPMRSAGPPPPAASGPPPPLAPSARRPQAPAKPQQVQKSQSQPQEQKQNQLIDNNNEVSEVSEAYDFTKVPTRLDKKFEELSEDSAVRPTIIKTDQTWTKKFQKALLAEPSTETLHVDEQKTERNRAFDLLDALSRSGALSLDYASLHVIVAVTHCFDKSLMNTLVQDNVNPIEKVERSSLIISTTIHDKPAEELIKGDQKERIGLYNAKLLTN